MSSRSANATIKGYFYQFDQTIEKILLAPDLDAVITVEGIEDIDIQTTNESSFIQCKYYEETEYNHSTIKDAITQMVRHFEKNKLAGFIYILNGFFKNGQEKLPNPMNVDFIKSKFLTSKTQSIIHEVHKELQLSDTDIAQFILQLKINIKGKSYDQQQASVEHLIKLNIHGATTLDVQTLYYPLAINTIQNLSIQKSEANRKIIKRDFLIQIKKKELVFSKWLEEKFGAKYYVNAIKRSYFKTNQTRINPAARIFVINCSGIYDISEKISLITILSQKYSHTEHRTTPAEDRFCPYILLLNTSETDIITIKHSLFNSGIMILDGYPFKGSIFFTKELIKLPTKDNPYKIKFIPSRELLLSVINEIHNHPIEVFEFLEGASISPVTLPSNINHKKIHTPSLTLIKDMI